MTAATITRNAAVALRPRWRAIRVTTLGAASLSLAVTAHQMGGGAQPSFGLLAVTALLLGMIAVPLTARRCGTVLLLGVLSIEQLLLHWLFTTATGHVSCPPAAFSGAAHHAVDRTCLSSAAEAMPVGTNTGWTMWLAHAAAVLATAWVLARGEAWLWRTAERAVEAATAAPRVRPEAHPPNVVVSFPLPALATCPYPAASPRAPPTSR
jgi:hypothetical protein